MYKAAILSVLVACIYASHHDHHHDAACCSMGDKKVVLENWNSIWSSEHSGRRTMIAVKVFEEIFEKAPESVNLFKRVKGDDVQSPEFKAHCVRVVNALDIAINLELNSDVLVQQLQHLGEQHAKIDGMKAEYFDLFREASVRLLSQAIPCFDSGAWSRCMRWRQGYISQYLGH